MRGGLAINVACLTLVAALPDASQNLGTVKDWARNLKTQGELEWNQAGGEPRFASPADWELDTAVYQVFTDRFNNGNASNDQDNLPDFQTSQQQGQDLYDVHAYRHGGDIAGVTARLDYLKEMGITSIWLTPIFKNGAGEYHGYCVSDFTAIDPGFGTIDELRELTKQAHARDIKIILDIVVNHMCDQSTSYAWPVQGNDHYTCSDDLATRNWNGMEVDIRGQGSLNFGPDFYAPFKSNFFFNRCGANSYEDMSGTGNAAVYGDFVSTMFDFDTNNGDFQEIFTDIHKYWIATADVDGFRLDAVKHVTASFVAYFSTHIREYANTLGKDNFYLIGEIAADTNWQSRFVGDMWPISWDRPAKLVSMIGGLTNTYQAHPKQSFPGLTAVYNFAHGGTARGVFRNEAQASAIEGYLYGPENTALASKPNVDAGVFWNLNAIHDWPRFLEGSSMNNNVGASISAQAYLTMSEGIPIIYYGEEQGMNGNCHWSSMQAGAGNANQQQICSGHDHALYRQSMWTGSGYRLGSAIPSIDALAGIGPTTSSVGDPTADPFLDTTHDLYKAVRTFLHIRKSCAVRGPQVFRWNDDKITAFSRPDSNLLVIINYSGEYVTVPTFQVGVYTWMKNLVTGDTVYTTNGAFPSGYVLAPYQQLLAVPYDEPTYWDANLSIHLCGVAPVSPTPAPVPTPAPEEPTSGLQRTVVFIYHATQIGQDMFVRGGLDHSVMGCGAECAAGQDLSQCACAVPITHSNTGGWFEGDNYLDWYGNENGQTGSFGTPLAWTTNDSSNANQVSSAGYGYTPLNEYGEHYWMMDVMMDCSKAEPDGNGEFWFEVKSYITNVAQNWENNVNQPGAPRASGNHFAKCGKVSVFRRNEDNAIFKDLGL